MKLVASLYVLTAGCSSSTGSPDVALMSDAMMALRVASVTDLGKLPLPSTRTVGRDGGTGGELGGKLLWTFGDTFLSAANPIDGSNVLSATGGWSTKADPLTLVQPVDGGGFPAQLVPYTSAEIAANTADALDGFALWPGALIDLGESTGLLVFQRIKRTNGSGFDSQGVATARIAVDATVATRTPGDLFAPPEPLYMPTFADGGFVYAIACAADGFLNQSCKLARAPAAQAETRAAYTFWDGTSYQADIAQAVAVIDRSGGLLRGKMRGIS